MRERTPSEMVEMAMGMVFFVHRGEAGVSVNSILMGEILFKGKCLRKKKPCPPFVSGVTLICSGEKHTQMACHGNSRGSSTGTGEVTTCFTRF